MAAGLAALPVDPYPRHLNQIVRKERHAGPLEARVYPPPRQPLHAPRPPPSLVDLETLLHCEQAGRNPFFSFLKPIPPLPCDRRPPPPSVIFIAFHLIAFYLI